MDIMTTVLKIVNGTPNRCFVSVYVMSQDILYIFTLFMYSILRSMSTIVGPRTIVHKHVKAGISPGTFGILGEKKLRPSPQLTDANYMHTQG